MKAAFKIFLVVLVSSLSVKTAYADSDGYYCVGRNYLAYQFGYAAPPVGPHQLFVIPFGGVGGIELPPMVLDLPQFQVHGMRCGDRAIRLAAYDAIYTVELDKNDRPTRYTSSPWLDRGHTPPEFVGQSSNLGAHNLAAATSTPHRISLGSVSGGDRYVLEMTARALSSERCPRIETASKIVRLNFAGVEIQQYQIYRGDGIRECGD
jgi:hypothetical protein